MGCPLPCIRAAVCQGRPGQCPRMEGRGQRRRRGRGQWDPSVTPTYLLPAAPGQTESSIYQAEISCNESMLRAYAYCVTVHVEFMSSGCKTNLVNHSRMIQIDRHEIWEFFTLHKLTIAFAHQTHVKLKAQSWDIQPDKIDLYSGGRLGSC